MGERVYSLDNARLKIEKYCAYQDRCHSEVKTKLRSFGLLSDTIDLIMIDLMNDDFLNEERFARSFVSGKFKIKQWGRIKISQKLKEKQVSTKCIEFGMQEIDPESYQDTLEEIIVKKWVLAAKFSDYDRKGKVASYCYSRGFESDLIWKTIEVEPWLSA
ncbi:MAG: regulatory protein [Parvicellaceae bacterium]|jgi:regulatory protein